MQALNEVTAQSAHESAHESTTRDREIDPMLRASRDVDVSVFEQPILNLQNAEAVRSSLTLEAPLCLPETERAHHAQPSR